MINHLIRIASHNSKIKYNNYLLQPYGHKYIKYLKPNMSYFHYNFLTIDVLQSIRMPAWWMYFIVFIFKIFYKSICVVIEMYTEINFVNSKMNSNKVDQ